MSQSDDLRTALVIAADHLAQYRKYSEVLRAEGRGLSLSSPYQPEHADLIILRALDAVSAETVDPYSRNVVREFRTWREVFSGRRHAADCRLAVDDSGEYINCYRPLGGCTCGMEA